MQQGSLGVDLINMELANKAVYFASIQLVRALRALGSLEVQELHSSFHAI